MYMKSSSKYIRRALFQATIYKLGIGCIHVASNMSNLGMTSVIVAMDAIWRLHQCILELKATQYIRHWHKVIFQ